MKKKGVNFSQDHQVIANDASLSCIVCASPYSFEFSVVLTEDWLTTKVTEPRLFKPYVAAGEVGDKMMVSYLFQGYLPGYFQGYFPGYLRINECNEFN